jgi:ADP-ribosyl-[dinitrogen reductase] hydrolase
MKDKLYHAFLGSLIADAAAMPVHWYYDVSALDRDYPDLELYTKPNNPHPDSILWRSSYQPRNKDANILHDQAQYWGKRNVHYHQFLSSGENTLNFKLAAELYHTILDNGGYDMHSWLATYVQIMRTPNWHRDTYVEEYHRAFFDRLASGVDAENCGIDDLHIGGLASVPALLAGLSQVEDPDPEKWVNTVLLHVALTHSNQHTLESAEALARILLDCAAETPIEESISKYGEKWSTLKQFQGWSIFKDRQIVGRQLTPACYLPDAFTAALYLSWKYREDFHSGILANARCGGDNCHRGAVVGSLLGGTNKIPPSILSGLAAYPRIRKENQTVSR